MDVFTKAEPPAFKPDQSLSFTCTVGVTAAQLADMRAYYRQQGVCDEHTGTFQLFDLLRIALESSANSLTQLMDAGAMPDPGSVLHMDGRKADGTGPQGFRVSLQLPEGFHRTQ